MFVRNDPRLTFDDATHQYALGGVPFVSVTQVLARTGLADFSAPWFSEVVRDEGTFMHDAIRMDVHGVLNEDTLDERLRGYVAGWRAFVREKGIDEVEYSEQMLCDPATCIAGRLDYIVRWTEGRGRIVRTLIDLKRGFYPCAAIQTAAYADMAAALYDSPVVLRRAALVLPGDGSYRLEPLTDSTDRATWQAAIHLLHWRIRHGLS
jgi:hypothetical protein